MKRFTYLLLALPVLFCLAALTFIFHAPADNLSRHVKITYLTIGNPPPNNSTREVLDALNKVLTEKVNAELELIYVPWDDYMLNYNRLLSNKGTCLDLVGTASDWLEAWPNVQRGAFMPLSVSMLRKNCPYTFSKVPYEHWDGCSFNGRIYLIPEDNYVQWINHGFMYRGDWAKEAGLEKGIQCWEDILPYCKYVREKNYVEYPFKCQSTRSIAVTLSNGYIFSKSLYIPLDGVLANLMFGVSRDNTEKIYSPYYEGDELLAFAKLMKEWDKAGVWPSDVLSGYDWNNREEFIAGRSALECHHTDTFYSIVGPKLKANFPDADCSFFWFGKESGNLVRTTLTHGAMAVYAKSKYPERALKVYDLLRNDPECYYLMNYGIRGKQYIIKDDGFRGYPEGYNPERDSFSTNFWWGRNDQLEVRTSENCWDKYEELVAQYDKVAIDYPYPAMIWDFSEISAELEAIDAVWNKYMLKLSFGKVENEQTFVKEFRDELKAAGIEKVLTSLQMQLDRFRRKHSRSKIQK